MEVGTHEELIKKEHGLYADLVLNCTKINLIDSVKFESLSTSVGQVADGSGRG